MSNTKKAVLFLILVNVIWGAGFPIYKWTLEVIDPFTFAFLRFILAAIIIFPFVYKNLKIQKRHIPFLILVSIISFTFQIPLLLFGLKFSPSINAPIIISSTPIFLIIASALFLKDVVKPKVLAGTLLSLAGVLIVMFKPYPADGALTNPFLGNILLFLSMLCGIAQAIVLKKLMSDYQPLTIVFWSFLIGSIPFLIPIFLYTQGFSNPAILDFKLLLGIGYATIFSSVIGYYFYYYGIKYIRASELGIFSYVDPIATIIVAIPLLGEKITALYALGSFLVFLGIFIAEERIHYHPFHRLLGKESG